MRLCDYHIADCERDLSQAREFGFSGESLGTCLAPGGFNLEQLEKLRTPIENRRIILIKGRQGGLVGKAQNVLAALEQITPLLREYQVVVLMPTRAMRKTLQAFANKTGLNCVIPQRLEYSELLALFGKARLAVSASDVDGTPSFLVEAMAMGALPVHSDMESVREWVINDVNGLLFPVDDIDILSNRLRKAVLDSAFVSSAAHLNWEIARNRMDRHELSKWIEHCITRVAA
jgi:glycosyltransferase involved in cell wall biosynthesis